MNASVRSCLPVMMIAILVSVAGFASATDVVFTSTADFDAGTKAPTTDGNLGIETNTDNLGIATGAFELGSLKGDSMTTADVDADTAKWNLVSGVSTGCGAIVRSISAGTMSISVASGAVGCRSGVRTAVTVTGDWDFRVKVDAVLATGATNLFELSVLNEALVYCTDGASVDGLMYQDTITIATHAVDAFTCVDGAFAAVGTQTGALTDPRWLRLTRATNTFTWYYSVDGTTWVQDEQTTNANIANPVYILWNVFSASAVAGTTSFLLDDHHLAAGTVSAGGYRTAGTWTSATQTFTTEIANSITVTYSGASVNGFIDAIRIVDALGATLFTDDTDRTSGTFVTLPIPDTGNLDQNWAARILLAGNGAATVTITEVAVVTAPQPVSGCFGESTFGTILFAIFGIVAGVSIFGIVYVAAKEGASQIDPAIFIGLVISIVVLVFVVAGFLGAFNMGATIGC